MFINEVLKISDIECPNPYQPFEKYAWCDELSAELTTKYAPRFGRFILHQLSDGTYLLPEHVGLSMIDRILCSGREIFKQDLRTYGISYAQSPLGGRLVFSKDRPGPSSVEAVVILPYEKIRYIYLKGQEITFGENCFFISENPFRAGDILKITVGDVIYDDIAVMDTESLADGREAIQLSPCALPEGVHTVDILRHVTEKTCCPPPYDAMYVDFINGKIALYQRDYSSYDVHMALFNIKLNNYIYWLKKQENRDSGITIKNWW